MAATMPSWIGSSGAALSTSGLFKPWTVTTTAAARPAASGPASSPSPSALAKKSATRLTMASSAVL